MNEIIPGILIIEGNRTYGKKNGNFLYKFMSSIKPYESFLVPYSIKNIGFSKCFKNKYVLVKKINAKEGTIVQTIGDTNVLEHFYDYNMHRRNLHQSIKNFTKDTISASQSLILSEPSFEDRTTFDIISIDPHGCIDIDDAFGVTICKSGETILSVYIANVPFVIDKIGLWKHLLPDVCRISSIYLPSKKISMLPNLLSDNLCSLLESQIRPTIAMDITLSPGFKIENIEYKPCFVKVKKNYTYDDIDKRSLVDEQYESVYKIVQKLNTNFKYLKIINDSHDVIAFLMILMNNQVAKLFQTKKSGIFRRTVDVNNHLIDDCLSKNEESTQLRLDLPSSVSVFLANRDSGAGNYCKFDENVAHKTLGLSAYVHITSPIRRLVDLLNIFHLQTELNLYKFTNNELFTIWYCDDNIELINQVSKKVRKFQNECNMLGLFYNDSSIINECYNGYVVDYFSGKYTIYLDKLNIVLDYKTYGEFRVGDKLIFKVVIFCDESNLKQKIRLHKVE